MVANVQQSVSGSVVNRWSENNIAAGIQWISGVAEPAANLPQTIRPSQAARRRFALDDAFTVVKHTLQIRVESDTVVNIHYRLDSTDSPVVANVEKILPVNGGTALTGGDAFQFDVILVAGSTYDIQHLTGTIDVAVIITESYNVDI